MRLTRQFRWASQIVTDPVSDGSRREGGVRPSTAGPVRRRDVLAP